ncbi:MAG: WGR domain-containing protein [Candidatus Zixiibacteriota bacterium]
MVRLMWIDNKLNRYRQYSLCIQYTTIPGEVHLVRHWGRIGWKMRSLIKSYPAEETAAKEMKRLIHQKLKKGYKKNVEPIVSIPAMIKVRSRIKQTSQMKT